MVSNGEAADPVCGVFVDDPELGSRMCGQPRSARAHGPDAFIEDAHAFEAADPAAGQAVTAGWRWEPRGPISGGYVYWAALEAPVAPDGYAEVQGTVIHATLEAAIKAEARRELAARVLPVLEDLEWSLPERTVDLDGNEAWLWRCPDCEELQGLGHQHCSVALLLTSLRKLVAPGDGQ